MRLVWRGAVARVLAGPARRPTGGDRADDHARPAAVPGDRGHAAGLLRCGSRPHVRRGTPAVRRGAAAWPTGRNRTACGLVARHHGTSEAGLDGGARPGAGRRYVTRGVPGDGVADIHRRLGEELRVVYAHRETCRYRRVEPAEQVCDSAVGAAWRNRPRTATPLPQSREPDAGALHRPRPRGCRASGDWRVAAPRGPSDAVRERAAARRPVVG